MASIVIDLDTSDANSAIQHSELIQAKNYEKLRNKIDADVRLASAGKDQDQQSGLTYFIDGTRGAGKSTFLRAAYNALTIAPSMSRDVTLGKLALIDPSKIEAVEIILLPILRELKLQVETVSCHNPMDEALHQQFRERFERLAGGLSLFSDSHDPLRDVDPDIFLDWGIERASHSNSLRKNLHRVIEAACDLLKVKALVLGFDDADTNAKKGREVLECIRKYLDTPRLIVLVTGDMELYSHLVRDHCFDSLGERLHRMDSSRNAHRERMVDHMEEQYLLKLFPVARRLQLKPLWNLMKEGEVGNQAPVFMLKCVAWNNIHSLDSVLEQILKAGLRVKANSDFALFREFLLKLPLRSVLQVLAQCTPHYIENDVENSKTDWMLQQAFCEGLRTVALGKLYKNEVNVDAIAADDLPSLIEAVFRLTIQDGDLDTGAYLRPQPNDDSLKSSFASLSAEVARLCHKDPAKTLRYLLQGPGSVAVFGSIRAPQSTRAGSENYSSLVYQFKQYLSIGRHEDALNWAQHATPMLVSGTQKVTVRAGVIGLNRSKPSNPAPNQTETYEKIIQRASRIPAFAFSRVDVLRGSTYTYASIFNILGVIERLLRIDLTQTESNIEEEVAAELSRSHQARSISMPSWTGEGSASVVDEDDEGDGPEPQQEKLEIDDRLSTLTKTTTRWLRSTRHLREKVTPSAVLIGKIWTRLYFSLVKSADINRGKKGAATIMEFYALCVLNALFVEEHDHHSAVVKIPTGRRSSTFRNNPSTSSDRIIKKIASPDVKAKLFPITFIVGGCPLLLGLLPADENYRPLFKVLASYWGSGNEDALQDIAYNIQNDNLSLNAAYIAGAT